MNLKETYSKQVEQEVKAFRKGVQKIENSQNPYYHDPVVAEYEIGKLRESLEANVKGLESEFSDKIDEAIAHQSRVAARSRFAVSPTDKQFVEGITQDLTTKLTFAMNEADTLSAIAEYEDKLESLENESAFSEVVKQLAEASRKVGDNELAQKKLRGLYRQLSDGLMTPEQEALESLKMDKLTGVTFKYKTLTMVHPAFKDVQAARKSNVKLKQY
ncbi:hypothetical protein M3196_11850 [Fictibacillus nanhaiensis]|uniref:hypothetical protein n=1 Tax=Fictibacillus nanhaiensis TaxID=742169 RepID=UPI002041AF91|nr:hypothetical protein [Fictibacillus nanhaiensis]MCM3732355.1 hypothetical protein [Fictibacillus nanhaiensis]